MAFIKVVLLDLSDEAEKITSKPHSPRTLKTAPAQQKEKTYQRAPVWCRPNTLRMSSWNYSHNSRVLERVNYAYLGLWGCLGFYSNRGLTSFPWSRSLFLIGVFFGRILRDPFQIGIPLRYLKTWRARHFLIYATVIGKQSFTNVVSLPYAFNLNPISSKIPLALLYCQLHDLVSLRVRLAGASPYKSLPSIVFKWGLTSSVVPVHFQPSAYPIVSNFYFILITIGIY